MISSAAETASAAPSTVKTRTGRWRRAKAGCSSAGSPPPPSVPAPPPPPRAARQAAAARAGTSVQERTSALVSAQRSRTEEPAGPMTKPAASSETARRAPPEGVGAAARTPWEAASTGVTPSPGRRGPEGGRPLALEKAAASVGLGGERGESDGGDGEASGSGEEAARCRARRSDGGRGGGRGRCSRAGVGEGSRCSSKCWRAAAAAEDADEGEGVKDVVSVPPGERKGAAADGEVPSAAAAAALPGKAEAARAAAVENAACCPAPAPPPPPPSSSLAKRGLFPSEPETKPNSSSPEEKERFGW